MIKPRPYMAFYKMQINVCNKTAHHILKNKVNLILPKFPEGRKSKRGIFSTIISGLEVWHLREFLTFYTIGDIKPYIKQYAQCHLK